MRQVHVVNGLSGGVPTESAFRILKVTRITMIALVSKLLSNFQKPHQREQGGSMVNTSRI